MISAAGLRCPGVAERCAPARPVLLPACCQPVVCNSIVVGDNTVYADRFDSIAIGDVADEPVDPARS